MIPQEKDKEPPNHQFPKASYFFGLGNTLGNILFDNFYTFFAIMLGSGGIIQGFLISIRHLGSAFLYPVWGSLADRYDRRYFLFGGNLILLVVSFIIPFSTNPTVVLLILTFQTLFGTVVVIPAWNAYLGDFTEAKTRATMLGKINAIITWFGHFILLATTIWMDFIDPGRSNTQVLIIPFFLSSGGYGFSMILTFFLPKSQPTIEKESEKGVSFISSLKNIPKPLKKFLLADFIFTLSWGAAWPIFTYVTFGVTNSWFEIGALAFLIGISMAISQRIGGSITDSIGRKKVIIWSRGSLIITPLFMAVAVITGELYWVIATNIFIGLFMGGSFIAVQTYVLDMSPTDKKATYISIANMVSGFSVFIGSTTVGIILQVISGSTPPTLEQVGVLLMIIFLLRFILWFSYFIIEDTKEFEKRNHS